MSNFSHYLVLYCFITEKKEHNSIKLAIRIQESYIYKGFIIALIIGNLIILLLNRSSSSKKEIFILDIIDGIFCGFFLIEMIISIAVLGISVYLSTKHIDLFTNILGIVEISLTFTSYTHGKNIYNDRLHNTRNNNGI